MSLTPAGLADVARSVRGLRAELISAGRGARFDPELLHHTHRRGAVNLLHYLALRRRDARALQEDLARLGLSSLGRCESHVLASVDQVVDLLDLLTIDPDWTPPPGDNSLPDDTVTFDEGRLRLVVNTAAVLGPRPPERATRIMVTMPSQAAADPGLARELVRRGMDCARINCAHDHPAAWEAMIDHVRKASADEGRPCRILMDLAGPKLRTGPLPALPGVTKLRPLRDRYGRVLAPASAWLVAQEAAGTEHPDETCIPVPSRWLATLKADEAVKVSDTRQKKRRLEVVETTPHGVRVQASSTIYLAEGTPLRAGRGASERRCEVGALPADRIPLVVRSGDRIVLTADLEAGTRLAPAGEPARVGCTLPEVFDHLSVGDRVWFDDGKLGGVVAGVRPHEADVDMTMAPASGAKLRSEKGINLPDTDLHLSAITADDAAVLPFVAAHADLVGMSFVQRAADVTQLHRALADLGAANIGIVLKVETVKAFERLPDLLLAAMAHERVAVMIARGDLAVECGYERLAEVQEEILWLAEAAHLPVIWATDVLDRLARTGRPSRAEITDAAMSQRSECVMLNKGPHIVEAASALDDILRRMTAHQDKKAPLLRELHAWSHGQGG